MYTLVVDAPANSSSVQGTVTVRGRAPGFENIEVWDAAHTKPPLASATPSADGAFSTTVNAASLATGATTWTVNAWDSPAGQPFMHNASVPLSLTIGGTPVDPGSCDGQTCSGHGTCGVTGGKAVCTCNVNYHSAGMTCVSDSTGNDGTPDPGTAYVPQGYTLKFSDEFAGGSLDTGKWNTLAPFGVQFFSDSHQKQAFIPQAVTLANGIVTFTAQKSTGNTGGQPYSSGSITTNGTFTYGYFEARTRVPAGKGFWPAFWLTSSTRWPPEWDIFEIIDGVIYGYTHPVSGGKCQFVEGAAGGDSTYTLSNVYGVYHVYGFKWTASDIYWYVDGVMTEHYSINAAAGANDPFWLNISLQVGGDWPGDPNGSTPFPGRMDVDYIRVYQQ
jgi:beta-glucanase (GH16 family)